MAAEAQKRASKKYYQSHKDYYREKTKESIKRIRKERWEYKRRNEKAIEYINNNEILNIWGYYNEFKEFGYGKDLLNILQGEDK